MARLWLRARAASLTMALSQNILRTPSDILLRSEHQKYHIFCRNFSSVRAWNPKALTRIASSKYFDD